VAKAETSYPTAADSDDEVLYAIFLSLMPGKTLTPTAIDQHAAQLRLQGGHAVGLEMEKLVPH